MNKTFQPGLSKTLKTFAVGLLLIIFAFYDLSKSDNSNSVIGYIMLGLGIHYIIQCLNHFYFVYKSKREYRLKIEKDILRMNQANQLIVMEFTEDHFSYEELDYNSQIKWSMFKCFRIVEDNIFLDMDRGGVESRSTKTAVSPIWIVCWISIRKKEQLIPNRTRITSICRADIE